MEHPGFSTTKKLRNREKGAKHIGTDISEIGAQPPLPAPTQAKMCVLIIFVIYTLPLYFANISVNTMGYRLFVYVIAELCADKSNILNIYD